MSKAIAFCPSLVQEAEEVTVKFGIKLGGIGIPILAEGSTEGNFEVEVKCKFPDRDQNSSTS